MTINKNAPNISSFRELDPDNVYAYPEYAYFGNDKPKANISISNAQTLFAITQDYRTFMNPENLQDFFTKYHAGNYNAIMKRFNFVNYEQVDGMYQYLIYLIENQLGFAAINGTYEQNAFAQLMIKSMNSSLTTLQTRVPFELYSRYLTTYIVKGAKSCTTYLSLAVTDPARVTAICNIFDFTKLTDVKTFLAALYYKGTALDNLKAKTNMTDAEITSLFNVNTTNSFGQAYTTQL